MTVCNLVYDLGFFGDNQLIVNKRLESIFSYPNIQFIRITFTANLTK